jgi:hypothetical protein
MLDAWKIALAQRLNPVHVANSVEEKEAIYRFRYAEYVGNQHLQQLRYADHEGHRVKLPADDLPGTTLYYVGTPTALVGTMRVTLYGPGQIPADFYEAFSLHLFPDIASRMIAEYGSFVFRPSARGSAGAAALGVDVTLRAARAGCHMAFAIAAPGLLRAYRRLGFLPYGGRIQGVEIGIGPEVPIAGCLDAGYLARLDSPVEPFLRRLQRSGDAAVFDVEPLWRIIEENSNARCEPEQVELEIEEAFAELPPDSFLAGLPAPLRRRLADSGHILDVRAGDQVILGDMTDREVYVILEGALEARRGSATLTVMERGETFGEVGFFRESGRRSASVRALTDAKLLVLRRKFLRRLVDESPRDACAIYEAMCRVMAERVARN